MITNILHTQEKHKPYLEAECCEQQKKKRKGKEIFFSKTVIGIRIISYHAYFVWGKKKK